MRLPLQYIHVYYGHVYRRVSKLWLGPGHKAIQINHICGMVPISDGSSEHGAHIRSQSGISIFFEGIWIPRKSRYILPFSEKTFLRILLTCATRTELPFYISTMYAAAYSSFLGEKNKVRNKVFYRKFYKM